MTNLNDVKPRWLDVIIRQLLVNSLGGRGIESRRQLSFAERTTLTREAKTNWKRNEKRRARERPLL